jgi:hypothetical protein
VNAAFSAGVVLVVGIGERRHLHHWEEVSSRQVFSLWQQWDWAVWALPIFLICLSITIAGIVRGSHRLLADATLLSTSLTFLVVFEVWAARWSETAEWVYRLRATMIYASVPLYNAAFVLVGHAIVGLRQMHSRAGKRGGLGEGGGPALAPPHEPSEPAAPT